MNQKTIKYTEYDFCNGYIPSELGEEVILLEYNNTLRGGTWYKLIRDFGGVGGNLNPQIKRYHGWRGTTDNISCYACGLRKVIKIRKTETKKGEPLVYVTVGKDIHPDWE